MPLLRILLRPLAEDSALLTARLPARGSARPVLAGQSATLHSRRFGPATPPPPDLRGRFSYRDRRAQVFRWREI